MAVPRSLYRADEVRTIGSWSMRSFPEAASQTFRAGEFLTLDPATGRVSGVAANGAINSTQTLAGIAARDGQNNAVAGAARTTVRVPDHDHQIMLRAVVGAGGEAATPISCLIGSAYPLVNRETAGAGSPRAWSLDQSTTTNGIAMVVGYPPGQDNTLAGGFVLVKIITTEVL